MKGSSVATPLLRDRQPAASPRVDKRIDDVPDALPPTLPCVNWLYERHWGRNGAQRWWRRPEGKGKGESRSRLAEGEYMRATCREEAPRGRMQVRRLEPELDAHS